MKVQEQMNQILGALKFVVAARNDAACGMPRDNMHGSPAEDYDSKIRALAAGLAAIATGETW